MKQKTIFTVIGAILVLQGILFFVMGNKMSSDIFPNLDEAGRTATVKLMQVMAMLSIIVGLISFAASNTPQVLWAYTLGFALLSLLTLKHMLMDHINVPIFAIIIQIGITLLCGYLWMQNKKPQAS
jgi:hypothetical protein